MGRGRRYNPILSIFTLSIRATIGIVLTEFCYRSFSGFGDIYIKPIRERGYAHLFFNFQPTGIPCYSNALFHNTALYLLVLTQKIKQSNSSKMRRKLFNKRVTIVRIIGCIFRTTMSYPRERQLIHLVKLEKPSDYLTNITALLTDNQPGTSVTTDDWNVPSNI